MMICEDCGATFEEPIKGYGIEKDSCPNCGSWGISVARKCAACGELIPAKGFDKLCDGCIEKFNEAVDGFIEMYVKELGLTEDDVTEMIINHLE